MKHFLARVLARFTHARIYNKNPQKTQGRVLKKLISTAKNTKFGRLHNLGKVRSYDDFRRNVPVYDYEKLRPYIGDIQDGTKDILWVGKPLYFAKTSGTTSGIKYIPITKESIKEQIKGAKHAILAYLYHTNNFQILSGKMIFLQGSPILKELKNGIKIGRLSGIVAHYVPGYLRSNHMPSWQTNCIEDWETKLNQIIEETIVEDMTVISGIPSWLQMYFEKLLERASMQNVKEVFPNLKLLIQGGVNYEPYRKRFNALIGDRVDNIELYPASEGFFAFQDTLCIDDGMLLRLNAGIFYEFIPLHKFDDYTYKDRICIDDVELGVNYVMIISTNAGLWAYNIGDTVVFISLFPHRIKVVGRLEHFISAFGEHVIVKEVETALNDALNSNNEVQANEFTVAPQVIVNNELPHHQWFIEFERLPNDMKKFSMAIDQSLQNQNIYYQDLIKGKMLQPLKITVVPKGGFQRYMKSVGKLGGQNKIPKLSNDRKLANNITSLLKLR